MVFITLEGMLIEKIPGFSVVTSCYLVFNIYMYILFI